MAQDENNELIKDVGEVITEEIIITSRGKNNQHQTFGSTNCAS